jgi:putative ATP-dependent endonuclease of OLD family
MKIERVSIKNFRNFEDINVEFGDNIILVGANATGKSNFIYALRLLLDPTLSHRDRMLVDDDFWRGNGLNPWHGRVIEISIDLVDFKSDIKLNAVFSSYCLIGKPETANLTYIYKPKGNVPSEEASEDSYEYEIYGGGYPSGIKIKKEQLWGDVSMQVVDALRDASANLTATKLPLRRLLKLYDIKPKAMEKVVEHIKKADDVLQNQVPGIKNLEAAIQNRLVDMTEHIHDIDPVIRLLSSNAESLIRALRILVEGGQPIDSTSLGLANVLFLTLSLLEVEEREKVNQPKRDEDYHFTILGIEEPEAHLHPHLQRILLRDFLKRNPIIISTHSPHIASVCPLESIAMLRKPSLNSGTEIHSLSNLANKLSTDQVKDLQRYLDVTRAEILFARAVIFVEGDAEQFLLPELARQAGYDLDKYGISICSVGGTDFLPYVLLAGFDGLNIPYAVLTDGDKYVRLGDALASGKNLGKYTERMVSEYSKLDPFDLRLQIESDGIPFYLGFKRGIELGKNSGATDLLTDLEDAYNGLKWGTVQDLLEREGIFINEWSFEPTLIEAGYLNDIFSVLVQLDLGPRISAKISKIIESADIKPRDIEYICRKIEDVGKGRVAQRLSSILHDQDVGLKPVPIYITKCLKYLIGKLDDRDDKSASLETIVGKE